MGFAWVNSSFICLKNALSTCIKQLQRAGFLESGNMMFAFALKWCPQIPLVALDHKVRKIGGGDFENILGPCQLLNLNILQGFFRRLTLHKNLFLHFLRIKRTQGLFSWDLLKAKEIKLRFPVKSFFYTKSMTAIWPVYTYKSVYSIQVLGNWSLNSVWRKGCGRGNLISGGFCDPSRSNGQWMNSIIC